MNSVEILGYLKEIDGDFRIVEAVLPTFNDKGKNTALIRMKYWTTGNKCYFLSLPINSHVAIRGHLDVDEKFGTIVIVEQVFCIKK